MHRHHRAEVSQTPEKNPALPLHPPPQFLPPYPPPPVYVYQAHKLPPLDNRTGNITGHLSRSHVERQQTTEKSINQVPPYSLRKYRTASKPIKTDAAVWTDQNLIDYKCFLCGVHFSHGDMLYAHVLVVAHYCVPKDSHACIQFHCRRCGQQWNGKLTVQRMAEMKRHGCVQQKAAYLSKFVIPDEAFGRYGLPFFCLLCCTEPTQLTPGQYRPIRKNTTVPLTLCENAMRFESKLHLTVHILCCHSTRTQPGSCGECSFHSNRPCKIEQVWDANKFWTEAPERSKRKERCDARGDTESSSTDSESDVPRPIYRLHDSILGRQGLTNLEQHLDDIHWPLFKLLSWYIKGQETVPNRPRTEVYSCPLCELIQIKQVLQNPDAQSDDSIHGPSYPTRNRHSKQNNALLQSHIACYHAGSKQTDMLFGLCQVCGHTDSMRSVGVEIRTTPREPYIHGSAQHLIRAGHVGRLQREFTRCVDQGRLSAHSVQCLFDWTTVCLFCWQRFTCQLGPNNRILHAQCALQTHLIVAHCTPIILVGVSNSSSCSSTETIRKAQIQHQAHGSGMIIRQCGWCGQTPEDLLNTDEMISSEPESSEMLQALIDSDPQWAKIYADYRWYQTHEKAHAVALYEWWQDQ